MLDMGINVALGTDGPSSNNNLDMFEEMHIASIIHNGYTLDATVMNADTVLKMATVNGAKVQRRENCGELKVGNKAARFFMKTASIKHSIKKRFILSSTRLLRSFINKR